MRLVVMTPQSLVVDREVVHVRAEDASGAFGVLDRHADLITALTTSVLVFRAGDRREHFVAVRGGLLTVRDGRTAEVVTREAVASDDLVALQRDVLARFQRTTVDELRAHRGAGALEEALRRHVAEYVTTGRGRR